MNLSPNYLSKTFKKDIGINFITYITNKKIALAKEMLKDTDTPILNISIDLSFNKPNYFSKVFKKIVGLTPSEYRNTLQNDQIDT
ncbi:helix-turn-helix domain-containing protein [Romboutsia hominis]|uniref:helix-turn-helix domain-containing protein n=1 Tax=Romboutsia hominis TaxID=1507512 RepID=UPI003A7F381C